MSRYKVLHLITHLGVGGAQDNTLLTVERTRRDRFEVHIAGGDGEWSERARSVADRYIPLSSLTRRTVAATHLRALHDILRLLLRERYQIVHTHSTHAGILGRVAAKVARVPIIVHTVHGFAFDDLTLSPQMRALLLSVERGCARLTDRLVMVSNLNREQALRLGIAPADRMVVIYSGIDLSRFQRLQQHAYQRADFGLSSEEAVIGWVGRLCEQNAPELFIAAAREVAVAHPRISFVMVGDGPLRELCEGLAGGMPQLRLLGYRPDIPRILPLFDMLVSTVRWAGLGRVVTEAMLAGLPVVATAVNGVPEIIHHGTTGLLVPAEQPAATAWAINYLLDHPPIARALGRRASDLVRPLFSAEQMAQQVSNLYEQLIREKGLVPHGTPFVSAR
jgi:glycosyltransferase involved in cell wall biosynthesis